MRYTIIALVMLLFVTSAKAQEKIWTLKECVNYALENNISVKQIQNTILSNEQDVKAAKGQFLPTVGANASQSLSFGGRQLFPGAFDTGNRRLSQTSVGANVSQTLFNGFRNVFLYKQSQLNVERSQLELSRIQDDIALNVVNSYLNILFNKENLEIAKSQVAFSEKQVVQVKALVDAGVQPKANIYDAEANLSRDKQNETVALNSYILSKLTLSQLLQIDNEGFSVDTIDVDTPSESLMYSDIKPILNYAFENRNEIKVAQKDIENTKLTTKLSKSGYYPNVSVGYGLNASAAFDNLRNDELKLFKQLDQNLGHGVNLNVNVPIFSGFQNETAVAKAKIQEENTKLNLEQAKLNLTANIQRAFTDAQAAFRTYEASKITMKSQELAFENAKERYEVGAINAFDLEQSRIALLSAKASLINAKYDFVFKTKVLDFYIGKPIL